MTIKIITDYLDIKEGYILFSRTTHPDMIMWKSCGHIDCPFITVPDGGRWNFIMCKINRWKHIKPTKKLYISSSKISNFFTHYDVAQKKMESRYLSPSSQAFQKVCWISLKAKTQCFSAACLTSIYPWQ